MNRLFRAAAALGLGVPSVMRRPHVLIAIALTVAQVVVPSLANAATLSAAKVGLSDSRPYTGSGTAGANVTYTATVSSVSATALRCITATYVTTPGGSTAVPGMSASSATVNAASTLLNASTGSWTTTDTANQVKYTNTTNVTAPSTTTGATFIMQAIQNGNTSNTSYWLQFKTFSDNTCATPIDSTIIGFIYNTGSQLSFTVDANLTFTVAGISTGTSCIGAGNTTGTSTATTLPFGTVTSGTNGLVCQTLAASTNASNGFTIYTRYTGQITNGLGQTFNNWTGTSSIPTTFPAPGTTEAYGFSTNDPTLSNCSGGCNVNRYTASGPNFTGGSTTDAEIAYESAGVTAGSYIVAHEISLGPLTKPGDYTTTVIYTCTPVY